MRNVGAKLNPEMEHQTARDTTDGKISADRGMPSGNWPMLWDGFRRTAFSGG